jgi:hypothetical protein
MGGHERWKPDPLVTRRNLECVIVGKERYLCTFSGQGKSEQVMVIGIVLQSMQNEACAAHPARKMCEKGQRGFVGVDVQGNVYLATEIIEEAGIEVKILATRGNGRGEHFRRREFRDAASEAGQDTGDDVVVKHTQWAQDAAMSYADVHPKGLQSRILAELAEHTGDTGKRMAIITALQEVAAVFGTGKDEARGREIGAAIATLEAMG